jgi:ferredoxin
VSVAVLFECPDALPQTVDAADGSRLVDICDESGAEVPFSCRSASCGTCRIVLVEGGELLEPADEYELELLAIFGDNPLSCRLACQARLRVGVVGRLRLRVFPLDE